MKLARFSMSLALALSLVGCGSKGTPTSASPTTDSTPPSTPIGLHVVGDYNNNPVLTWTPNSEADIAGYEVYVYSPAPGRDNAYVLGGDVTNGAAWSVPATENVTINFYKLCAVDVSGNRSGKTAPFEVRVNPPAGPSDEPPTNEPVIRR